MKLQIGISATAAVFFGLFSGTLTALIAHATNCTDLRNVGLDNASVTSAEAVETGPMSVTSIGLPSMTV